MEAFVKEITTLLTIGVNLVTGLIIGYAVFEAVFKTLILGISRRTMTLDIKGEIRLGLGQWLALSLELALAADILNSVVAPTFTEIGKLAAIATIRTALNYFLSKEIADLNQKKRVEIAPAN